MRFPAMVSTWARAPVVAQPAWPGARIMWDGIQRVGAAGVPSWRFGPHTGQRDLDRPDRWSGRSRFRQRTNGREDTVVGTVEPQREAATGSGKAAEGCSTLTDGSWVDHAHRQVGAGRAGGAGGRAHPAHRRNVQRPTPRLAIGETVILLAPPLHRY